jgi:sulfur carrier protein
MRDLVERLELAGKRIAVERNGEIVPRSQFESVGLTDGDALEIVVAVGGG